MKFWNMNNTDAGAAELRIEGEITGDRSLIAWLLGLPDSSAPAIVESIRSVSGPLTVWINSPGGSVVAASTIYTALRNHNYPVTVNIDGEACSAASMIAMAGDRVCISPTAMMMIHNVFTAVEGDMHDLERGITMLQEAQEAVVNAYTRKTGLARAEILRMMDETTFMSADTAIRLGFADCKLFDDDGEGLDMNNMMKNAFNMSAFNSRVASLDTALLRDALDTTPTHTDNREARLRLARKKMEV